MHEHVHTGVISFLFAGISAVVFIQMLNLSSAWLIANGHESSGRTLGSLVNFGG